MAEAEPALRQQVSNAIERRWREAERDYRSIGGLRVPDIGAIHYAAAGPRIATDVDARRLLTADAGVRARAVGRRMAPRAGALLRRVGIRDGRTAAVPIRSDTTGDQTAGDCSAAETPLRRAYGANMEMVFESGAKRWRTNKAPQQRVSETQGQSEKPLVG
jgi:hypothetical protein